MENRQTKKHTVLWADDDPDDLLIMRETLERINTDHNIIEASNGKAAIDYLCSLSGPEEYPCLIILDNNMPIMNGRDTFAALKGEARFRAIPVVVFTTSDSQHDRNICRQYGAAMYTKPSTIQDYTHVIAKLLTHCGE